MKHAARLVLLALAALAPLPTHAQRVQGPTSTPGVRTVFLSTRVEVVDGVATTRLLQRIRNDSSVPQGEGIWILQLPRGAVADELVLRDADGVEMDGEVLDAGEARGVYESIVRRRRDPALLEYVGRGCLRARVFPVPAGREVEVEVRFRHVLPSVGGLTRWTFPVAAAGIDGVPPDEVTLDLTLRSKRTIGNAFSPDAGVDVVVKDEHTVLASYEGKGSRVDGGDLSVVVGYAEGDLGLDLLTSRVKDEAEGSFLLMVSPRREVDAAQVTPREITFVLDTSGSMAGEKIDQARGSLRYFLKSLTPRDRFNVVPFSTEARPFFDEPRRASQENVSIALGLVNALSAFGGTNVGDALRSALKRSGKNEKRIPIVVFLTDGRPTVGTTELEELLALTADDGAIDTRIFVLGVGDDVNTVLLDTLAERSRGTRDYVRPSEDIEVVASALFTKLSRPVLTDLELEVDGVRLSRTVPAKLPDLFAGERLEVLGRYTGAGEHAIRLTGTFQGERRTFVYEGRFAGEETHAETFDFVPVLWAERRVAYLLDEMRLAGKSQELVDEVVRLGRTYGIVTPFTSHLVVEQGLRLAQGEPARELDALRSLGYSGTGRPTGPSAPGPVSPGTPATMPAANSAADDFFLGRGALSKRAPSAPELAASLRENGVLDERTDDEEALSLANQLLEELGRGSAGLADLADGPVSGAKAVERSRVLSGLMRGDRLEEAAWSRLFVKHAGDRVFHLWGGVWTEAAILAMEPAKQPTRVRIPAFSDAYFALLGERPDLVPYLAVGERVALLDGDRIVEVVPPEERD